MISADQYAKMLFPITRAGSRATDVALCRHVKCMPVPMPEALDGALSLSAGATRWTALWWDLFDEDWVCSDGRTERHVSPSETFPRFLREGPLHDALCATQNVALVYDRIKRDGFVIAQGDALEFVRNRVAGKMDRVAQVLMCVRSNLAASQREPSPGAAP